MKKFSKEELLERAAPFFKNGITLMIGTEDGNLWYEEHRHLALNHAKPNGLLLYILTPEGIEEAPDKSEVLTESDNVLFDSDKKKVGRPKKDRTEETSDKTE